MQSAKAQRTELVARRQQGPIFLLNSHHDIIQWQVDAVIEIAQPDDNVMVSDASKTSEQRAGRQAL